VKSPDQVAVNAQTGFLLRAVSAASYERMSEIVCAHGLHPMHFGLMMMIDAEEPISQHELGRRTGIDPSSMVARMDALDEHGLIQRERSADDRRSYEIRLSPAGRKLLAKLRNEVREHGERFFAPLTKAERKQLHELLAKLAGGLDA
jgi:DNA-binding MarR family transcriptional regulator